MKNLSDACFDSDMVAVRRALRRKEDVHVSNDNPLRLAIQRANFELVKMLIEAGADMNAIMPKGETSFYSSMKVVGKTLFEFAEAYAKNSNLEDRQKIYNYLKMIRRKQKIEAL